MTPSATTQTKPKSLSNKFSNLDAALTAELAEGSTGDEGAGAGKSEKDLEAFFQSIYGDLGEEGKRAMMKSFTESGGTVLSTDWGDVGARKVVPQPPK
jgi:suppressor of G2 allele of SKP1